jgi:hypothetical protein
MMNSMLGRANKILCDLVLPVFSSFTTSKIHSFLSFLNLLEYTCLIKFEAKTYALSIFIFMLSFSAPDTSKMYPLLNGWMHKLMNT